MGILGREHRQQVSLPLTRLGVRQTASREGKGLDLLPPFSSAATEAIHHRGVDDSETNGIDAKPAPHDGKPTGVACEETA